MSAHGTRTRYVHERCRCKRCVQANADYHRERRLAEAPTRRSVRIHGTRSCYVGGCRCGPCTDANGDYGRSYRKRFA